MSDQPLAEWPRWRERLIARLRASEVPGDRIGDILLEVDAHLSDTGESPEQAFGDPGAYAAALVGNTPDAEKADDDDPWQALWISVAAIFGVILLASGAQGLGQGTDAVGTLPAWFSLVGGVAVLIAGMWWLPTDLIRHPATGRPLLGDSPTRLRAIAIALLAIVAVAFYIFGRLLA